MARKKDDKKGIFSLETDQWFHQKDRSTIEPALRCIELYQQVKYEHRDVATKEEFQFYLDKYFVSSYDTYPILYLGFHGSGGAKGIDPGIYLGDDIFVTLAELEEWIGKKCNARIIYFGACGVMDAPKERLDRFIKNTKALAIAGYSEDVDWLESTAFDMLALGGLQHVAFTKSSVIKFKDEFHDTAPGLHMRLGFNLFVKT